VVILNSQCSKVGGCQEGSAQQQWLATDLAAHTNTCTIAAWHHPRWSSYEKPNDPRYDALWRTLAEAGADVLVVGHAHQYQRFAPMDANGQADPDGLREFVVGTGGKHIHSGDFLPNENTTLETANDNSFGVLLLTLHPTSYDWEFAPIPGEPFTDSGSTNCSTGGGGPPPTDITPPSAPTNPRTTSVTSSAVDLAWDSSTDNVGVTGYTIYRTDDEGLTVFSVNGSTLAYQDATVTSGATYSYTIDAFDAAGNHSAESTAVVVTIPPGGPTSTLTFTPTADSYVDASKATTNYGTSSALRADAAPDVRSYLRFNVQVGTGTVTRATLRIFANSASSSGISARSVSGSWTESTINYNNRPAMGGTNIGSSGPAVTGTWLSMDVTPLVAGNGNIDIGVLTAGSTAISLASRESVNDPQLVVEFSTGGGGDAEPPTVPGGVTATTLSASSIRVDWNASADNVGVTSYQVYRDGSSVATVNGSTATFTDSGLSPSTLYGYTVEAFDAATNPSGQSTPPATATTQAAGGSLSFAPTADSYVSASSPATNYGASTALRVDGSPDVRSYLRFNVQVGTGTITRVTLRIFANTGSSAGLGTRSVGGAWAESTLNYNNAPALAGNFGSSGPAVAGTWLDMDVTALVTGNGDIDIGVVTAISLASRESANAPQLVVEFSP
jgi:chitodextrinase